MNRFELFNAMVNRKTVTIIVNDPGPEYSTRPLIITGKIVKIELEDGSGQCFNVTFNLADNTQITVFVRSKGG